MLGVLPHDRANKTSGGCSGGRHSLNSSSRGYTLQLTRQFYKPSQAAEILQVSTRSLYRIIDAGTISVVRLMGDRRIRIPAKALERLADSAETD